MCPHKETAFCKLRILQDLDGAVCHQIVPGRYTLKLIHDRAGLGKLEAVVGPGENHLRAHLE